MERGRNRFKATAMAPEIFFVQILEALRHEDLGDLAETFQRKSIFLDLGTLNGFTTFIVWITCPDSYNTLTNSQDGLDVAKAANKAAKALGMEGSVRTVIAFYGVKTVGGLC
jgi:hypothetical protein